MWIFVNFYFFAFLCAMDSLSGTSTITSTIVEWYRKNRRDLPWRVDPSPYKVWLSEIILQQTRVDQGLPYFASILDRFPSVNHLANAPLDDLLKQWQGLGYYSRARNMHEAAKQITTLWGGKFPNTYDQLLTLKGVGEYTAAAVASICFGQAKAVVDGNVFRVLARVFGMDTPINTTQGKRLFTQLAQTLLDENNPSQSNQAMMEFGALQCTPALPNCPDCPLKRVCNAFIENKIDQLPVKIPSKAKQNRYFIYLFVSDGQHTWLHQRQDKDIWQNLWEFPLIELDQASTIEEILASNQLNTVLKTPFKLGKTVNRKHILSHRILHTTFIEIRIEHPSPQFDAWKKVPLYEIQTYAVPRLLEYFISDKLGLYANK